MEENITYTTENIKWNSSKDLIEKDAKNIRVQNVGERLKDVVAVEMKNIQTKAKHQKNKEVVNEVSNNLLQTETMGKEQRKEKAEEPKYSDRSAQVKRTQQSNCNENKTEKYCGENEQQDIKNENSTKRDKYLETEVQCRYCQKWFNFKCEETTKEKGMQEYPEETQYICKQDKINQTERIWESKYKITVTELDELKDK